MVIQNNGIYQRIEEILRASDEPQTCVDVYEKLGAECPVRDANRVSDFLGHMWRRGLLQRWYAPKDLSTKVRYAYTWIAQKEERSIPPLSIVPNTRARPNVTITEEDSRIVLDFAEFTITVQSKR